MRHTSDNDDLPTAAPHTLPADWDALDPEMAARFQRAFAHQTVYVAAYADELAHRLSALIDTAEKTSDTLSDSPRTLSGIPSESPKSSSARAVYSSHKKPSGSLPPATALRIPGLRHLMLGAACLALLGFGIPWLLQTTQTQPEITVHESHLYTTARAERATVTLPDGSTVILNAESTLEIAPGFGTHHRNVTLRGEGYFSVHTVPHLPFRIQAGPSTTQVLGTTFNVRNYPTDSAVQIAVVEGRVLVGHTILVAGDVGHVVGPREPVVRHNTDVAQYAEWIHGGFVFDDMEFQKILVQLERTYDIEIRLADPAIGQRRLSGAVRNQTAGNALQYFAIMLNARAERDGRIVTLYSLSK